MKILFPVALLFVAVVSHVMAADEDFLEPEEGYFSSYEFSHKYHAQVRNILLKGANDSPLARIVTLASFIPETVISVEKRWGQGSMERDTKYVIVQRKAAAHIWDHKFPPGIKVRVREMPLDKETALLIHRVFFLAVSQTRYPSQSDLGLDGTSYYFSSYRVGDGLRAGQIWSPEVRSVPGALVSYGHLIEGYLKAPPGQTKAVRQRLRSDGQALLKRLERRR